MSKQRRAQSKRWFQKHLSDPFVKLAQTEGYRSRAAYKLLEVLEKYECIPVGATVVDLGAAPGSWSQVASKVVGPKGKVIAVDILTMDALPEVDFIQGDFTEEGTQAALTEALNGASIDCVLSDMAPNLSGVWVADQARAMDLAERVWWFTQAHLSPGGSMIIKLFQGPGLDELVKELKGAFKKVLLKKPKASRPKSREFYLLALTRK